MRTLAIGDIHGCNTALSALLDLVQPRPEDTVVTLGDYVDGGPDSSGVIGRLLRLGKHTQLVPLLGNHEQMMLAARHDAGKMSEWLGCGGKATLRSYKRSDTETLSDVPAAHWKFIESCRDWHEDEKHIFVHANADPSLPMAEQPVYMLRWERVETAAAHESGKTMICGHTAQKSGEILDLGYAICIDTHVDGRNGWLTCLDVRSYRWWQANEAGQTRDGSLEWR